MPRSTLLALCPAMLLLAAGAPAALAQDEVHWEDAISGDWSCFLCWDPDGPPTPIDAAKISVGGAYTVTLDSSPSIEGLTMDNPDATLFMSGRTLTVLATLEDHGAYIRAGVLDLRNASSIITPRLISLQGADAALLLQNSSSVTADVLAASEGARILAISGTSVINANFLSLSGGGLIDIANSKTLQLFASEIDGGGGGLLRVNPNANLLVGDVVLQDTTVEMDSNAEIRGITTTNILSIGPTTPAIVWGEGTIHDVGLDIGQHGVVEANTAKLTIYNTQSGGFVNQGVLRASSGVELHLGNSAVNNTGGIIEALDGSIVTLSDQPLSINGGELRTEGSGVIKDTTNSGEIWLSDLVINGHYLLGSSGHTNLQGTIQAMDLVSVSSGSTLEFNGDVLLHGAGEIVMSGSAMFFGSSAAATLTNNDILIHGRGTISTFDNLTNYSTISADDAGTLIVSAGAGRSITNRGTLRAENGAQLSLRGSAIDNTDGVIEALDGSLVTLTNEPISISRGALRTEGSGIIRDTTNSGSVVLSNVTIDAHYDLGSSGETQLRGTIENHGIITLNGSSCVLEFVAGSALADTGEIQLTASGCSFRGDGTSATLVNNSNTIRGTGVISNFGTLTNLGSIVADAPTALVINPLDTGSLFDNQGEIRVESAAGLNIPRGGFVTSGQVYVAPGALLQRSTSIDSDYRQTGGVTAVEGELRLQPGNDVILDAGILTGSGVVAADILANAGAIEPGSPVGRLVADRTVALGANATLRIDGGASFSNDRLHTTFAATLGGTLEFVAAPGDEPRPGQTFTVLTASEVAGQFDSVLPLGFSFNRTVTLTYEADRVIARIARECVGDWTDDGAVNTLDVLAYLNAWSAQDPAADINADGVINTQDILGFLNAWSGGC